MLALEAARALLEHGISGLSLWDMNSSQGQVAIERLRHDFPSSTIMTQTVDVTDADQVGEATTEAASQLGPIMTLCCFAGVVGCVSADSISSTEWRRTLDINTTGEFLCAQAVARQMITQKSGGSIVLIGSISGVRVNNPQPQVAYNVSKAAVINLATSLAAEWAVHGIRVNSISPGYMDTILNEGPGIAKARKVWNERNPMGRMGTPSEITGPLVLLCSRYGGAYITGSNLVVDGKQILCLHNRFNTGVC